MLPCQTKVPGEVLCILNLDIHPLRFCYVIRIKRSSNRTRMFDYSWQQDLCRGMGSVKLDCVCT